MLSGALMGAAAGVVVWALGYKKANAAKAGEVVTKKPQLTASFESSLSQQEVLKRLREFTDESGYKVDPTFAGPNVVCLTTMPDMKSFGWFYPVYVTAQESGSVVEVGIVPRYGPGGLPTKRFHAKGVEFVKELLH